MFFLTKTPLKTLLQKAAVISVKWFYIKYEPENLDVKKVYFAKWLDIPSTHEESVVEPVWSTLKTL